MSPHRVSGRPPPLRMWTAFCTCGWWDLFRSEAGAQEATDRHRKFSHHFEVGVRPPKGQEPKDPRHIR